MAVIRDVQAALSQQRDRRACDQAPFSGVTFLAQAISVLVVSEPYPARAWR